ncbi:hypothetical protein GCM10009677_45590 [Sphaerisporangium rubeum]|uniref:Uncharacterized protein YceH (UPF0502 family) n=1 Tax=Sphaerisporangium rubeum TaxID=321317 RepID=A0A7X0M8G3_9ACTN|nr:hypothetical protein [Sphaerisporangium rubeum]MBB6474034.1 uncharacterized protein YceH (UPF0502 family) [Sphaerisporangium rubeum]
MPRQIAAYQPPSSMELEARVHNLELQVAHLTEAVRSLTAVDGSPGRGDTPASTD